MIEIRSAQPADLLLLRAIAIQTQVDTFGEFNAPANMEAFLREAYDLAQFEKEFQEEGSIYYMAWEGNEPAGFLRLRLNDEVEQHLGKNSIELQRIYVTKPFLGKKVGFMLMQTAITYAREKKFDWLWLGVWEKNLKAQDFYRNWGFERFSQHIFWMGPDPQTDWLLKLKL